MVGVGGDTCRANHPVAFMMFPLIHWFEEFQQHLQVIVEMCVIIDEKYINSLGVLAPCEWKF